MDLRGKTDAQIVEICHQEMQSIIDRTDWSGSRKRRIDSVQLPHKPVHLKAADLTEIGKFQVDLPPEATVGLTPLMIEAYSRHWVYRHSNGKIVSLQLSQRRLLKSHGYAQARGFVNDFRHRN